MNKSIIQHSKYCLISGAKNIPLHKHHCLTGGLRNFAEREGLFVYLSWNEHRKLHVTPEIEIELKRIAQYYYEFTHTREEWMLNVHKNYLATPLQQAELDKYNLVVDTQVFDIDSFNIEKLFAR